MLINFYKIADNSTLLCFTIMFVFDVFKHFLNLNILNNLNIKMKKIIF